MSCKESIVFPTENLKIALPNTEKNLKSFLILLTPKIFPLTCMFGISFNILSFVTITKSSLWKTTLFRYLAFLSLADFFVIVTYVAGAFAYVSIEHISEFAYTIL